MIQDPHVEFDVRYWVRLGAALRPAPSDTAFPHRRAGYSILIIAQWRAGENDEQNIAWAKET